MCNLSNGVQKFQNEVYPGKKDLFEKLSNGQSPNALFITCADSRIDTGLITQTDPGDLFVCRNAGNIVPPYEDYSGGLTASIEYAMEVLKIPNIVICGHSDCGAMKGAMNPEGLDQLPQVKSWLNFSQKAVERIPAGASSDAEKLESLIQQNVILQLEQLKTHPSVAKRLEKGEVELHGWVYDIKSGSVLSFDAQENTFKAIG